MSHASGGRNDHRSTPASGADATDATTLEKIAAEIHSAGPGLAVDRGDEGDVRRRPAAQRDETCEETSEPDAT